LRPDQRHLDIVVERSKLRISKKFTISNTPPEISTTTFQRAPLSFHFQRMAITILAPAPAEPTVERGALDSDFDDSDSDVDMEDSGRPAKRSKTSRHLVTPGELVTDDSQWMR
jgi:hypothetical protein